MVRHVDLCGRSRSTITRAIEGDHRYRQSTIRLMYPMGGANIRSGRRSQLTIYGYLIPRNTYIIGCRRPRDPCGGRCGVQHSDGCIAQTGGRASFRLTRKLGPVSERLPAASVASTRNRYSVKVDRPMTIFGPVRWNICHFDVVLKHRVTC